MDKYIKYPLPLKRDEIKKVEYMRHGGFQLIEIMEKEFPFRRLLKERDELGINFSQLARLFSWIKHNTDVEKVKEEFGYRTVQSAKSFFYRGAGILGALYRRIDTSPVLVDGEFESKYSFIRYEVIENEVGTLVISRINESNWSNFPQRITQFDVSFIEEKFYYQKQEDKLVRIDSSSDIAKQLNDMYQITDLLSFTN